HFLKKLNVELQTEVTKLQPGVMERLMRHPWEGNVRELENVLVEAVVRARSKVILLEEIEGILSKNGSPQPPTTRGDSLLNVEKEHIENTLFQVGWNRTKASQILSISLPTLRSKIRKYGITPPS
ncbi:MAG: sigma-54-dependent Fis family transcriptional regulator, partial [Deltaproteobacteria bacterium]|nr:sigma-54-dependent Fis family transcriptional regulator [Deltaproteobacteria bacterium]